MSADVVLHALGLEEFQLLEVVENKERFIRRICAF